MRFALPACLALLGVVFNGCSRPTIEEARPAAASVVPSQTTDERATTDRADESPGESPGQGQAETVAPAEWVALHLAAVSAPGSRNWQEAVLKLQQVGDGISVEYLRRIKVSQLKEDDQRILQETIAAIERRLKDEDDATAVALLQTRLERAAYADLTCNPLEGTLVPWTLKYVGARANHPPVRARLEQLRANYDPDETAETESSWMTARVQVYITRLLNNSNDTSAIIR